MASGATNIRDEAVPADAPVPKSFTAHQAFGYNVSCTELALYLDAINVNQPSDIANRLVERSLSYSYQSEEL
jgi:hypothetical protein